MSDRPRRQNPPLVQRLESRLMLAGAPQGGAASSPAPLRINAGGGAYVDSVGQMFEADTGFTGGRVGQAAPGDVQGTADDPLFYTYRAGREFDFSRAVADGNYALWLEFAEPETSTGAAGQRVFDVSAESRLVLDDFDVAAAAGGAGRAVVRAFDVAVTGGALDLSFRGVVGEAIVSAVVLVPTDPPPEAAAYGWGAMTEEVRSLASSQNLRQIALGAILYANQQVRTGRFPPDLATLAAHLGPYQHHSTFASPRTSTALPRGELSPVERVAWVAARRDYVYVAAGRTNASGPEAPLAYENPQRVEGDILVAFCDGHVEELSRGEAAALLGFPPGPPSDPPLRPATPAPDADTVQSAINLRHIARAVYDYVNTHPRGPFPDDLGVAYESNNQSEVRHYVNPRTSTVPPPDEWTDAQKAEWIRNSTDYLYLGRGKRSGDDGPYEVIAYENPAGMAGGINLMFGHGRVEFRETRWVQETLAAQDRRLLVSDGALVLSPAPQAVTLEFTRSVGTTLSADDFVLTNLTRNEVVPSGSIALGSRSNHFGPALTFPGYPDGRLPDGNYRLVLPAGAVADAAGRAMPRDYVLNFFVLAGDVNRDRAVNGSDFAILAGNFGRGFSTLSHTRGDLNGDQMVNGADFAILAGSFGKTLAAPPVPPSPQELAPAEAEERPARKLARRIAPRIKLSALRRRL